MARDAASGLALLIVFSGCGLAIYGFTHARAPGGAVWNSAGAHAAVYGAVVLLLGALAIGVCGRRQGSRPWLFAAGGALAAAALGLLGSGEWGRFAFPLVSPFSFARSQGAISMTIAAVAGALVGATLARAPPSPATEEARPVHAARVAAVLALALGAIGLAFDLSTGPREANSYMRSLAFLSPLAWGLGLALLLADAPLRRGRVGAASSALVGALLALVVVSSSTGPMMLGQALEFLLEQPLSRAPHWILLGAGAFLGVLSWRQHRHAPTTRSRRTIPAALLGVATLHILVTLTSDAATTLKLLGLAWGGILAAAALAAYRGAASPPLAGFMGAWGASALVGTGSPLWALVFENELRWQMWLSFAGSSVVGGFAAVAGLAAGVAVSLRAQRGASDEGPPSVAPDAEPSP